MESGYGGTVEQKPMSEAKPLEPPTAEVAKAYLDEKATIERLREDRVDRGMLGWLHLVDGFVVGALFSAALFVVQSKVLVPHLWLLVIFGLMLWMQFKGELGERLGVRSYWFRSWSLPYMLVFIPTLTLAWSPLLSEHPSVVLAFIPFGVSVLVFGSLAVRQWRKARGQVRSSVIAEPEPFTRRAAVATITIGAMLGLLTFVATGAVQRTVGLVIACFLLCAFLVFTITAQTGTWMPVLGRIWLWPQWTALVLAGVAFLSSLVLGVSTSIITLPAAVLTGALVTLLFVVTAVWGVRCSSTHDRRGRGEFEGSI